jgi:hypothetical protein
VALAARFGAMRVRMRVRRSADLDRAVELASARVPARLELPTSLYREYERRRRGLRRIVDVERHVLDQPAGAIDLDLLDRLADRREALWIPPGPGRAEDACRLAALGVAVVLDRPRQWPEDDLAGVLACVERGGPPAELIEPFASLRHAARGGDPVPLVERYGEGRSACPCVTDDGRLARSADHAEAGELLGTIERGTAPAGPPPAPLPPACPACRALPTCGGYWLAFGPAAERCAAWIGAFERLRAPAP